jgi:hypothetical protein
MKFLLILLALLFSAVCLPQSGVVNSSLNYSIGDTKLSFQPLNPNNPTWIYANGATTYPSSYPLLYALLSGELSSVTSTLAPVTQSTNGRFGQGLTWLPNGSLLAVQRELGGTILPKAYTITWNENTRTLSSPVLLSNAVFGAVLSDQSNFSGSLYPYYLITSRVSATNNNSVARILKWDGSSLVPTQTITTSVANGFANGIVSDGLTQDYYLHISSSAPTNLFYRKPFGSEVWSDTNRTITLSSNITSIPNSAYTVTMISPDYILLQGRNASTGITAVMEVYKLNTVSNSYEAFQLICSGGTVLFQCGVPYGESQNSRGSDLEFFVTISQQTCGYRFNGTNFSQINCQTSQVGGITVNGFVRLKSKTARYSIPGKDMNSAVVFNWNGTVYTYRIADYNPTTMLFSSPSSSAFTIANYSEMTPFLDGDGVIAHADGTSFGGSITVQPLRKILPTLADPATGLKYQIKAR